MICLVILFTSVNFPHVTIILILYMLPSLTPFISHAATNPTVLLAIALFVIVCYALYLDHKVVVLTKGQNGASLEDVIRGCIQSVEAIEKRNELLMQHASLLHEKVSHAIRNVETIRYKAYDQNGSNQSFSVALVNEKGNGVVISSLHSHDRMSTFAKPIQNYESTYDLTEEELAVINDSKASHKLNVIEE